MTRRWRAGFRHIVRGTRRIAASRRVKYALLASGLSSLGNLSVSVAIARTANLGSLGDFAVAMSVFALVTGMLRSTVAHTVLVVGGDSQLIRAAASRVSLLGLVAGVVTAALGVMLSLPYVLICGLAIHGLMICDYAKTLSQTLGDPRLQVVQETVWKFVAIVASSAVVFGKFTPIGLFAVWAAAGAIVGYASALHLHLRLRPTWRVSGMNSSSALLFGVDYLAGSGVAQLTTGVVAGIAGTGVVGALRVASTALGPVTLVIGTAESLVINFLAGRGGDSPRKRLEAAATVVFILTASVAILATAVLSIPTTWGVAALGTNWHHAAPLLLPLSIEFALAVVTSVAYAGLRAAQAAGRSVLIRSALMPIRIGGITWAAIVFGAPGAAWAMVGVATLGAALYWWSYVSLTLRENNAEGSER